MKREGIVTEFHGTVYSGEAPESDDDEVLSISNIKLGQEATEVFKPSPSRKLRPTAFEGNSVLQKILGKTDASIHEKT